MSALLRPRLALGAWLVVPWIACSSSSDPFSPATDPRSPLAELEFDGSPAAIERSLDAALLAFKSRRFTEAKAIADDLLIEAPHHDRSDIVLFLAAESRIELGELDAAAEIYQRLANRYPSSRAAAIVPQRLFDIGSSSLDREPVTWLDALVDDDGPALDALGRVAVDYPHSPVADDAWMKLASAYLEEVHPALAARAYLRLIEAHPESALVEEASFRRIAALAAQSRGAGYDSEPLFAAREEAVAYLKRFGTGAKHARAAAQAIHDLTTTLVLHEEHIADFYSQRGNRVGEELHRNNALRLKGEDVPGPDSRDLLRSRATPSRFATLESSGGMLLGWRRTRDDASPR